MKDERKYLIPVDGKLYETSKEVYVAYYKMERRERYLEERDRKEGVKNFSDLGEVYCSADEFLSDTKVDIEQDVVNSILLESVFDAITTLDDEEKWLINELFLHGKSQRQVSKESGIPLMTVNYRKHKVIDKIKKVLKI